MQLAHSRWLGLLRFVWQFGRPDIRKLIRSRLAGPPVPCVDLVRYPLSGTPCPRPRSSGPGRTHSLWELTGDRSEMCSPGSGSR